MYYKRTLNATPENAAWILKMYEYKNIDPPQELVSLANKIVVPEEFQNDYDSKLYKEFAIHGGRVFVATNSPNDVRRFAIKYAVFTGDVPVRIYVDNDYIIDKWSYILKDIDVKFSIYDGSKQYTYGEYSESDVVFLKMNSACIDNISKDIEFKYTIFETEKQLSSDFYSLRRLEQSLRSMISTTVFSVCYILHQNSLQKHNIDKDLECAFNTSSFSGSYTGYSTVGFVDLVDYSKDIIHKNKFLQRKNKNIKTKYKRRLYKFEKNYGSLSSLASEDKIDIDIEHQIDDLYMGEYISNKIGQIYNVLSKIGDGDRIAVVANHKALSNEIKRCLSSVRFNYGHNGGHPGELRKWKEGFSYEMDDVLCNYYQLLNTDILEHVSRVVITDIPTRRDMFNDIVNKIRDNNIQIIFLVMDGYHDNILLKEYARDEINNMKFIKN